MATLPGPEDVGPTPDATPRHAPVRGWDPDVISRAASAAGRGLENLGSGIVDVAAQQQERADQLEAAQARGTATAAEISGHAALPTITDPNQLPAVQQGYTDARDAALSRITNPRTRAMVEAEMLPQEARLGAAVTARGNAINNDQQIATFEGNANTQIGSGARIDNDEASQGALDSISQNIDALVKSGAMTAVEGQQRAVQASRAYIHAREAYLEDVAKQTGDSSRLERFLGANEMPGGGGVGGGAATPGPAPGANGYGTKNVAYLRPVDQPSSGGGPSPQSLYQHLIDAGATANEALVITGAAASESNLNPNATHDPDATGTPQGYGLFGHKFERLDMRGKNAFQQADAALQELRGRPEAAAVNAARTPEELADAEMRYEAPRGYSADNPRGGDNYTGRLNTIRYFASRLAGGASPAGAVSSTAIPRAPKPDASNSYFIGDSLADGLRGAAKAPGDTVTGRSPEHVLDAIDDADPADLQGKTIYLSTGASNAPDATTMVHAQLDALKEKGVDMANVRVVGVGDRKDFVDNKVNNQLAAIAKGSGAVFTGPLDPSNLAKDRVHAADYQKALTQAAGLNDMNAGAKAQPHVGNENFDAANAALHLTPQEQTLYLRHLTNLNGPGGVDNPDGSRSTLFQTSIEVDGKTYNIPTVWDGKALPVQQAVARAKAEGLDKFPSYDTEEEANARYQQMHAYMEKDTAALFAQRRLAQGIDPSRYPIVPAKNEWPVGTSHVALKPDGTFDYVADDGGRTPVPGISSTGTPDARLPDHPTGSIIDHLPPQDRAEMVLKGHNFIDQLNLAKERAANQRDTQTSAAIKNAEKQMVEGQPVSPDVWAAVRAQAAASRDPTIPEQFARADAARYTLGQMKGMDPSTMHAFVDDLQGRYSAMAANAIPSDPRVSLTGAQLQAAQGYEKVFQREIAKDPLGRALKDNALPGGVSPIRPDDPNIVQSIQKRVADAQNVADYYKLSTPKFLLPQEKVALRALSAAGGQPMVDLASAVVAGAGANAGQIFKEIGADAPAFASVGALALQGAPETTIKDIAEYTGAASDPEARRDLPRFNEGFMRSRGATDPLGGAANGLGMDTVGRVRQTANILSGAQAMHDGADPKIDASSFDQAFFDRSYNKALGATYTPEGDHFGGLGNYGGGWFSGPKEQKILVPTNLKATDFGKVIGSLTDADLKALPSAPVYANGSPISAATLQNAHLDAIPDKADGLFHGRYVATLGDPSDVGARPVLDASGKPWVLDMNKLEGAFRSRFPDSYLDVAPTRIDRRARTAVQPYAGVPGIVPAAAPSDSESGPTIPQEGS